MIDVLMKHCSVRNFKDEPIGTEILTSVLEAGIRASTTGNMQVYSIVNTTQKEIKENLAPTHFNQKMVQEAPNVLTFCADFNRFNQWCRLNGAIPGYDNFLSFITAAIDALLVAQNVAIAAEANGLGICYLGTTIYNADAIIDILQLPKGVVPITTIVLGWPNETPELTDRLPLNAILHQETYSDYNDDKIKVIYSQKENLLQNKQFVADNNKPSLAHVFTEVRYKQADNEFFSDKLMSVLKRQGFL